MSGSGPRCEICLRQVDTDAAVRICPGCQQTYHLDCWEKRGACVHPDCQLRWWNLFTAGRRFWRRTLAYYRQAWTLHHAPIPPHIWAMLLGLFLFFLAIIFFTPVIFHPEDLQHYTPK